MQQREGKLWREANPDQDVTHPEYSDKTPSTAPDASFEEGAGDPVTGFDSPVEETIGLSNPEIKGQHQDEHLDPYYPPGGAPDGGVSATRREDEEPLRHRDTEEH